MQGAAAEVGDGAGVASGQLGWGRGHGLLYPAWIGGCGVRYSDGVDDTRTQQDRIRMQPRDDPRINRRATAVDQPPPITGERSAGIPDQPGQQRDGQRPDKPADPREAERPRSASRVRCHWFPFEQIP